MSENRYTITARLVGTRVSSPMTALRTPNSATSYRFLQLILSRRPATGGTHAATGPDEDEADAPDDLDLEERRLVERP